MVTFNIANRQPIQVGRTSGPRWKVDTVVLPKITTKLPMFPVKIDADWKHLSDLCLADPDCGTPGYVDILLGVEVFS